MASSFFPTFLDELKARTEIEDALKRFCRGVDRQDWELAATLYHPGGFDDHGAFKGTGEALIAHIKKNHATQEHSMHVISNVMIEFQAKDRALVETYCIVLQRFGRYDKGTELGKNGHRRFNSARYIDSFEERGGQWRVTHRTVVFGDMESAQMDAAFSFPPEFVVQKHSLEDPLYKLGRG